MLSVNLKIWAYPALHKIDLKLNACKYRDFLSKFMIFFIHKFHLARTGRSGNGGANDSSLGLEKHILGSQISSITVKKQAVVKMKTSLERRLSRLTVARRGLLLLLRLWISITTYLANSVPSCSAFDPSPWMFRYSVMRTAPGPSRLRALIGFGTRMQPVFSSAARLSNSPSNICSAYNATKCYQLIFNFVAFLKLYLHQPSVLVKAIAPATVQTCFSNRS